VKKEKKDIPLQTLVIQDPESQPYFIQEPESQPYVMPEQEKEVLPTAEVVDNVVSEEMIPSVQMDLILNEEVGIVASGVEAQA
jgi:hypothetical protein